MHTEEKRNKRGRKVAPGEQIAYNKTYHCNMQLFEDESGEYYPVVDRMEQPTLVRGEYLPIGNRFHYPKVWGRKYAATKLLEHIMTDRRRQIEIAQTELEKLQRCMDKVRGWSDTDL